MNEKVSYTAKDVENANTFAEYNNKVRILQKMMEKRPHLTSWLQIKVRNATNKDYYIPTALEQYCKIIDIELTEKLCKKLSCNPMKEQDKCVPNEKASYYYLGDDGSYDVQCQPSCFNTALKPVFNEDQSRAPDTPMLNWFQNECRVVNVGMLAFNEKPFYRSETVFEVRVNDMPTGFSRTVSDNQYGSGISHEPNPTYCRYYDREMAKDKSCEQTIWDQLIDAVLGSTLVNVIKSSVRKLETGKPFPMPDLKPLPTEMASEYLLDNWKNDINKEFEIPKLIEYTTPSSFKDDDVSSVDEPDNVVRPMIVPNAPLYSSTTNSKLQDDELDKDRIQLDELRHREEFNARNEEMSDFLKKIFASNRAKRDLLRLIRGQNSDYIDDDDIPEQSDDDDADKEVEETTSRMGDGAPLQLIIRNTAEERRKKLERENVDESEDRKKWYEYLKQIIIGLIDALGTNEFWESVGVSIAFDKLLDTIKKQSLKIVSKLTTALGQGALKLGGKVGINVLSAGVRGMTTKIVTTMVLRTAAKTAIMLAKMTAAAASVVGWVLLVGMFIDMMLSFWDPFNYNKMFPKEYPHDIMANAELALRQQVGKEKFEYTFDHLAYLLLTKDELTEIYLLGLIDRVVYLDALVVNSEGSRIDKGTLVEFDDSVKDVLTGASNEAIGTKYRFTDQTFDQDEEKFRARVKLNEYLTRASLTIGAIGGALLLYNYSFVGALLMLVLTVLLIITMLNLQYNFLTDPFANMYNRGQLI